MVFYTQDRKQLLFDRNFSEINIKGKSIEAKRTDGTVTVLGCYVADKKIDNELESIALAYIHGDTVYEMSQNKTS